MNVLITAACISGGFLSSVFYYTLLARSSAGFLRDKNFAKYIFLYVLRLASVLAVFYLMIRPGFLFFASGFASFIAGRYYISWKVKNEIFTG